MAGSAATDPGPPGPPGALARGPRRRSPGRRAEVPLLVVGVSLFVLGLIAFATFQTQHLFRDSFDLDLSAGHVPRNDGGILFGAVVASTGIGLVLLSLSQGPVLRSTVRLGGFVALVAIVLFTYFTIFVNGFIAPGAAVSVNASFLFHDAATSIPIATFTLAALTFLALAGAALLGLSLVAPDTLARRFLKPHTLDEHRARVVLLFLLVAAIGGGFLRQFIRYALRTDGNPDGNVLASNVVVVYYLLALAVTSVVVLAAWRTGTLVWGDVRDRPSRAYRRTYTYMAATENWLWGIILALTGIIFLADPVFVPDPTHDRVFSMNSRGTSMFFLMTLPLFVLQRLASRSYLEWLCRDPSQARVVRYDRLARLAVTVVALWAVPVLLWAVFPSSPGADLSPLGRLAIRLGLVAVALPFFAVHIDLARFEPPRLKSPDAPLVLLAAFAVAACAGVMLWGVGNSVTTVYTSQSGFYTADRTVLQPYATGIRFLGSLFLAVPLTVGLGLLAARRDHAPNPVHLVLAGLSIIAAMNLLMTINAGAQIDGNLRQRDVLIGFASATAASRKDELFILALWSATSVIGFAATYRLLKGRPAQPDAAPA